MQPPARSIAVVALLLVCIALLAVRPAAGLTIIRDYTGGTPATNAAGAGTLLAIFNAAADLWELAIRDPHTVTLHYGWAPITGSMANHVWLTMTGSPPREVEGRILFDNDNLSPVQFYLDPAPYLNEEFQTFRSSLCDFGGGLVNSRNYFFATNGLAANRADVLSMALHEIGHALGMSGGSPPWIAESADRHIDITAPLPYPGTSIPLATNAFGVTTHFDPFSYASGAVMGGINGGERRLLSVIDILADAQLSQFTQLNLDLAPLLRCHVSTGGVALSWTAFASDFVLEHSPLWASQTNWLPVSASVVTSNGQCTVLLPTSISNDFFHLHKSGPRWP